MSRKFVPQFLWKHSGLPTVPRVGWLCAFAFILLIFPVGLMAQGQSSAQNQTAIPEGIHKVRHVIIIMQENRSFDSYFGTFPGADGLPTKNGPLQSATPTQRPDNA